MENTTSNTNDNTYNNDNEELGALWKRTARNSGQTYLAGHLKGGEFWDEGIKVVVFSNKNKTNERAPDFRIYKSKPMQGEANAAQQETEDALPKTVEVEDTKVLEGELID
jgi:uncharacterized protein (DUF736 family)